jgi:hypothetical protein
MEAVAVGISAVKVASVDFAPMSFMRLLPVPICRQGLKVRPLLHSSRIFNVEYWDVCLFARF